MFSEIFLALNILIESLRAKREKAIIGLSMDRSIGDGSNPAYSFHRAPTDVKRKRQLERARAEESHL